jgi:hypothetical protein
MGKDNMPARAQCDMIWIWIASFTVTLVVTYITNSLLLDSRIAGFEFGLYSIATIGLGCFILSAYTCRQVLNKTGNTVKSLQNTALFSIISLIALVIMDSTFSAYIRSTTPATNINTRLFDQNTRVMELYPRLYYPTEQNFRLHKPGVSVSGTHYGAFYKPGMLESPVLVQDVLRRRAVTVNIDGNGFRENTPIEDAHIFALGDSFTFGWGVNIENTWAKKIEDSIDLPVFSLGIHDASPKQELELLKFVLDKHHVKIDHVLWQIYEGNDIEDTFADTAPSGTAADDKTGIVDVLSEFFRGLKNNSVAHQFRTGRVQLSNNFKGNDRNSSNRVDGIDLSTPVYYSKSLGTSMFHPDYIERGSQPESYILGHPHRVPLENTFEEMKTLSENYGFDVTVIIVPTSARLHGKYFEGFPALSKTAFFIDFVDSLSTRIGFTVINLYADFQPVSDSNLLYFRDDDHWNEEGHQRAAEIILQTVFGIENPGFN